MMSDDRRTLIHDSNEMTVSKKYADSFQWAESKLIIQEPR